MSNSHSLTNDFGEVIEDLEYLQYYTIAATLAKANLFHDGVTGTVEEHADKYMQELRKYPKDVVMVTQNLIAQLILDVE